MKVVNLAHGALGGRDAFEDGEVAVAALLGFIIGQMDNNRGVTAGDLGVGLELEIFVDLVDPLAAIAADEALADVVGDASAGYVVVEGEGVEVGAELGEQLVEGGGEVGAGRIVGVDPKRPRFAGEVEGFLASGAEVIDVGPIVAGGVSVDIVARAVLLADFGHGDAFGLGAGRVDYANLADGRAE